MSYIVRFEGPREGAFLDWKFAKFRPFGLMAGVTAAAFALVMWVWDWGLDPAGAMGVLGLRLAIALCLSGYWLALLGGARRVHLPWILLLSGGTSVGLFLVLLTRLHGGGTFGIVGFLYWCLFPVLMGFPLSLGATAMACVVAVAVPDLLMVCGVAPGMPWSQFNFALVPTSALVIVVSVALDQLFRQLFLSQQDLERALVTLGEHEAHLRQVEVQHQRIEKAESLDRMASSIAHHFNNKLQGVLASLEVLREGPAGPARLRFIDLAEKSANQAAEVSRTMLVCLGQAAGARTPLRLADLCQAWLAGGSFNPAGGLTLAPAWPAESPIVKANPEHLRVLLDHLAGNAQEAMAAAPGVLRLAVRVRPAGDLPTRHLFPVAWRPRDPAYACLEVEDTGCGMPDEDLDRLFDPFFSTKAVGRGLGLSVVLGVAQALGGAVAVRSVLRRGSAFLVILPLCAEPLPAPAEAAAAPAPSRGEGVLLLVDDDPMVLEVGEELLRGLGFSVLTARDGVEALEVFRGHAGAIGCVITDLTMPRMDGWQTLSALRGLAPGLPVILASGYGRDQVMAVEHLDQPQAFLQKPFSLAQLKAAIASAREGQW